MVKMGLKTEIQTGKWPNAAGRARGSEIVAGKGDWLDGKKKRKKKEGNR